MPKKDMDDREVAFLPEERHGRLKSAAITIAILIVIALVLGIFAVRTDAFKGWVTKELEARTGEKWAIESISIGFPYDLVLHYAETEERLGEEMAKIKIREMQIGLRFGGTKVQMLAPEIGMLRLEDDSWKPVYLGRLGDVREIEALGRLTESFRDSMSLTIERGSFRWYDADGTQIARAEDIDFSIEDLTLSSGVKLYHCELAAYDIVREDGTRERDVDSEWLLTANNEMLHMERPEPVTEAESATVVEEIDDL